MARNLSNPFVTLNETATEWVNQTQSGFQNVSGITQGSDMIKAMRVRLNGKGDTLALATSVIFSSTSCIGCFIAFRLFRNLYPQLYAEHGPDERTVQTITESEVIDAAGLEAWMLLSFQMIAMRLMGFLGVLVVFLCPLHWYSNSQAPDTLARLSLSGAEESLLVVWAHVGATYYVVFVTTRVLANAKSAFTKRRHDWLQHMPAPRATTVLVEGIPEEYRNDESLRAYFASLLSEQAVVRAYVVRKTALLEGKLKQLERVQRAAVAWEAQLQRTTVRGVRATIGHESSSRRQAVEIEELEVAAERARLMLAADTYDPDVCSSAGFVTFGTRMEARRALHDQFREDAQEFVFKEAPEPSDVNFQNLMRCRSYFTEAFGWICIIALFLAWIPLVVFTTGLVSLDSLQRLFPIIAEWRGQAPVLDAVVDGVFATMALAALMGVLPSFFLVIIRKFFQPVSAARSQLFLEKLYFAFQLVFVILVTALGQGLISTLVWLAEYPTAVLPLLARTLPAASHFYSGYMVLGWSSCCVELTRASALAKYLGSLAFLDAEEAVERSERDSELTGQRYGKSAMMLVISLVFSSLSPMILVFGLIYFATCRVVYGYLLSFAEPRRADLGGEFWVQALKQVHAGLVLYVLLMLGILSAHGAGPLLLALPTLPITVHAWYHLDRRFLWRSLPLEAVAEADEMAADGLLGDAKADPFAYTQPECAAEEGHLGLRRLTAAAAALRQFSSGVDDPEQTT